MLFQPIAANSSAVLRKIEERKSRSDKEGVFMGCLARLPVGAKCQPQTSLPPNGRYMQPSTHCAPATSAQLGDYPFLFPLKITIISIVNEILLSYHLCGASRFRPRRLLPSHPHLG